MQPAFDAQLEAILCQAVEIDSADQRVLFLDDACAGDAALRANLDQLIHNHFAAGSFLEHPALDITQVISETAQAPTERHPDDIASGRHRRSTFSKHQSSPARWAGWAGTRF